MASSLTISQIAAPAAFSPRALLCFDQAPAAEWVIVRGQSMLPTWPDGARLRVQPAQASELRIGDCVVYHDGEQVIAHRLIARRAIESMWWFQPKADAGDEAEPWQPETSLLGRVLSAEWEGQYRVLGLGFARVRQQWIGRRARLYIALTSRMLRPTVAPTELIPLPIDPRLTWGRFIFLRKRMAACLRIFAKANLEPIVLKGPALILTGVVDAAERPMADLDLLLRPEQAATALHLLQTHGYRLRGAADGMRASLDDQVPLEDPDGVVFDLHWSIVNGGWRFRDVIRFDEAGLWERSARHEVDGSSVRVMAPEDQLLHLASHLILSGATGLVWWQDVRLMLEHHGETLSWPALMLHARRARLQTIMWLTLDTLWQRWRIQVPPVVVRALQPPLWRRWALRHLLPQDLSEAMDEPRWQRHLRELLLMDRGVDRLRLACRWTHPPHAWHQVKCQALEVPGTSADALC